MQDSKKMPGNSLTAAQLCFVLWGAEEEGRQRGPRAGRPSEPCTQSRSWLLAMATVALRGWSHKAIGVVPNGLDWRFDMNCKAANARERLVR
jgi:hypothetical protein